MTRRLFIIHKTPFKSIRSLLVVVILTLTILPLALNGLISGISFADHVQNQTIDTLYTVALVREQQINSWIDELKQGLLVAYQEDNDFDSIPTVLQTSKDNPSFGAAWRDLRARYLRLVSLDDLLNEFYIVNPEGKIIFSTFRSEVGQTFNIKPFDPDKLEVGYFLPPAYNRSTNQVESYVSLPIIIKSSVGSSAGGVTQELIGYFVAQANIHNLYNILGLTADPGLRIDSYLVNEISTLITPNSSDTEHIGNILYETFGIREAVIKQQNGAGIYDNYSGTSVIGVYRWLPQLNAALLNEMPRTVVLSNVLPSIGVSFALVGICIILAILSAYLITRSIATPLSKLTNLSEKFASGSRNEFVVDEIPNTDRNDEVGRLARAFKSMIIEILDFIGLLESRVAERTQQVVTRNEQLQAISEITGSLSTIRDPNILMQDAVDSIQFKFDMYYVGLFLTDDANQWAILKAGSGIAGKGMIARGHKLKIGDNSMVGWCISHNQARIAQIALSETIRHATPELPDTRSEVAIPLRTSKQILGALTIQSILPNSFDNESMSIFQTLADHVAISIENARLYAEAQEAIESTRRSYDLYARNVWKEKLEDTALGYRKDLTGVFPIETLPEAGYIDVVETQNQSSFKTNSQLAVPLKARGQIIGIVSAQKSSNPDSWSQEDKLLLETLSDQLGVALDSARLFEEKQEQVRREQTVSQVTTRIRSTLDIDTVLQTTVRELREILDLEEVEIRLGGEPPTAG